MTFICPITYNVAMSETRSGKFTAAIIGAGAVGKYHINAQERLGSKIVIFEPNQDRAREIVQRYEGLTVVPTLDDAIDRADVVHICTPHKYHAEGALAAIRQKKPTIVEKPLTINLDESVDIYRAAKENGTPVVVGTSFRLTPPFMDIWGGLQNGEIGELLSLETTYVHDMSRVSVGGDWRKSPDRGSFLFGGGSHAIDLSMWLANQPATEVQARIGNKKMRQDYPGDEDFDLSIGYEDGTTGRVWLSAAAPLPQHGADVKVYGTKGAYRAHNKYPKLESYRDGDPDWTSKPVGLTHTIDTMSEIVNAYIREERDSFDPLPGIEDGLKVMIVMHMLDIASRSGQIEKVPSLEEVVQAKR